MGVDALGTELRDLVKVVRQLRQHRADRRPGVPTGLPVLTPLILLALPLFDTATVMWIRFREGRPMMRGDRCHLSHRLEGLGFTQRGAVLAHYLITVILILLAWALRTAPSGAALAIPADVIDLGA